MRYSPAGLRGPTARLTAIALSLSTLVLTLTASAVSPPAPQPAGLAYGWGYNRDGEVGNGESTPWAPIPVAMHAVSGPGTLTNAVEVAAGYIHSLARLSDSTVVAAGANTTGQLGDGTLETRLTPVKVRGVGGHGFLRGVVDIEAGHVFSAALLKDGRVVTWDDGALGQLGNGRQELSNVPVFVKGVGGKGQITNVKQIAAGGAHTLALLASGHLLGLRLLGNAGVPLPPRPPSPLRWGRRGFVSWAATPSRKKNDPAPPDQAQRVAGRTGATLAA